jgi:acyl-CoA synthetase (AMP-forming)/AMP-acid ligase II
VLLGYPELKLAFVVGVADPVDGQVVVALVVPWAEAAGVDAQALRRRLREELSSYKVPRHILVLEDRDVPWLVSQKVDRRALIELAAKRMGAG